MKHTRERRYKAAAALIASGNSKAAASESGVPASTIRHWSQHDDDFQMICQEIRSEFGEKIRGKLAEIIDQSAIQTLDRLINGDVIRDAKSGELTRIPVRGKDAAIIGAVAFDKHRLIDNMPTSIVAKTDMSALAAQFAALSQQWQEKQINVIPVQEETEETE